MKISQKMNKKDTIFALASAPGKSGVAVIRISGEKALDAVKILTDLDNILPNKAYYAEIYSQKKEKIDQGLILYFKSPKSFTGEDVVEFQVHGSIAVIRILIEELSKLNNFRHAKRGEFAKRAFLNGKLDLTQAEALEDLINSTTKVQLHQAVSHLEGNFKKQIEEWREELIEIMAITEAMIDFPDEDIPQEFFIKVKNQTKSLINRISAINNDNRGISIRHGLYVTISGKPNAGKSSLLNCLARREVAIVSDIPGTTRDILEVNLDIHGLPVILADTAGLRETHDKIESIGIEKAKQAIESAVLDIHLVDITDKEFPHANKTKNMLLVYNKVDLTNSSFLSEDAICISTKTNHNIDYLLEKIYERLAEFNIPEDSLLTSRERHQTHLLQTIKFLTSSLENHDLVLAAEDLRHAKMEFEAISGIIDVENILDKIFSSFCIGK